jgi:hypothetical protein
MDLNIVSFGYLFLRLAPFVLVCFFSLSSLFNQDYKGLVYLVGLLFACFATSMFGKIVNLSHPDTSSVPREICNMLTMGQIDNLSELPLGQTVFGYTFAYILYVIIKYQYLKQNTVTIVFFVLLIACDFMWNVKNTCYTSLQLVASLGVGTAIGYLWAYVIDSTNSTTLQYFAGLPNNETCSKPSAQTFRCNVYKNGKLVSQNIAG